ncbi:helix-turn-helix domain-containing protein [Citricoccus nitrophenolicus]|uniref:AraC-like ligand-binding domain-containing protein n=1 Tax=Citricoccus nitrophenolicus TaxID=863575 RepID=UPI0031E864FB
MQRRTVRHSLQAAEEETHLKSEDSASRSSAQNQNQSPQAAVRSIEDWGVLLSRSLMSFEVELERPGAFQGYLRNRKVAGIEFIEMSTGKHLAHRGAESISSTDRPDYLLCLQIAGVGEFSQDNRTAVLQPGDLTLFDTTRPTTVVSSTDYRNLCMKFPQRLINLPPEQLGQLTATRTGARDGFAPAAGTLLITMNQLMDTSSGRSKILAAQGALDIITTMFQRQLDISTPSYPQATSSALLEQIRSYIDENLSDPGLGPRTIAAAHYISLRQLHGIFQAQGLTVASWVRHQRLQRCRRDLSDPALHAVSAASIGLRWGFKTASHFGMSFRKTFGLTPAEFRQEALSGSWGV